MPRFLRTGLLAAALALPATASAADTLVAPDPAAQQITALDGTIVWVSGKFGHQKLMQRNALGVITPVRGAPESRSYRSIDLGRSRKNRTVLTYLRCDAGATCKPLSDDLAGHRASFRRLTLSRCSVTAGPSQWRHRIAYGLTCTGSARNRKLSGLYLKTDGRAPKRLPRPRDAVKYAITNIESVDLRGTRVAAVAADIYEYSFSETIEGKDLQSFFAAASEGESDESARGLAIQSTSAWWTLTNASHAGDPNQTRIVRSTTGCEETETLTSPPDADGYLATDIAVDGAAVYLLAPGAGIFTHTRGPGTVACS